MPLQSLFIIMKNVDMTNEQEAKRILVVEDDKLMLTLLEFKLKEQGYVVTTAENGMLAKEMVQNQSFDLIVSDIMMPYFSGLELANVLRNDLKKTTPLILLSASGQESTVIEAFELGVDDFISKPFSPIELVVRVKKLIQSKR